MIHAFAGHSSGSDGWSEVRWLEVRARGDPAHLISQRIEHQVARRTKDAADIRNLEALALHL
jgi:hypothetical protein